MPLPDLIRVMTETREETRRGREEMEKAATVANTFLTFSIGAAKEANDLLDEAGEHVDLTISQIAVAQFEAQKMAAAIEAEFKTLLADITSKQSDLFDFAGMSLEEFVANQRTLIEQIEGTGFGAHLELFAKAYIAIQNGQDTTGKFFKQLEVSEEIIRKFTGLAGTQFDFFQFKADIDAALRDLKAGIAGGKSFETGGNSYGGYGPTSGTLGGYGPHPCCNASGQVPLSIMMHAGATRWVR
jgi:hypothetical protein